MKILALFTLVLCIVSSSSNGQTKDSAASKKLVAPWWVDKFRISAGFFVPINNTKIQVGANGAADLNGDRLPKRSWLWCQRRDFFSQLPMAYLSKVTGKCGLFQYEPELYAYLAKGHKF